jgi:hypothetical protein
LKADTEVLDWVAVHERTAVKQQDHQKDDGDGSEDASSKVRPQSLTVQSNVRDGSKADILPRE